MSISSADWQKFCDQIDNREVLTFLNNVEEKPVFYREKRLLAREEITDYRRQLRLDEDKVVPLLDLGNNCLLVYRLDRQVFAQYDLKKKYFFKETNSAREFLNIFR